MKKTAYILSGLAAALLVAFIVAIQWYSVVETPQTNKPPPTAAMADPSSLVRGDSPSLGPMMARVTVVEFLDPECESCRAMHPIVKRIMREYEGRVRLVIRYMPLHNNSVYAATVLEAAGEQGRYWEMLDILFQHQPEWGNHQTPRPELIPELAARTGLDMKALEKSVNYPAHKAKIQRDFEDGKSAGVTGTPTFFVNGRLLQGLGYNSLNALIREELSKP